MSVKIKKKKIKFVDDLVIIRTIFEFHLKQRKFEVSMSVWVENYFSCFCFSYFTRYFEISFYFFFMKENLFFIQKLKIYFIFFITYIYDLDLNTKMPHAISKEHVFFFFDLVLYVVYISIDFFITKNLEFSF